MEKTEKSRDGDAPTPVCGIGASAGGVSALQSLFRELPTDLGLAYVVIIHLAPEHPSVLSEILTNSTEMPVHQVEDGPQLKPNCVYVIPPDRELIIEDDTVTARPFTEMRGTRAPIDMFFRSVASARGDGLAVILTGAGSDGSVGVGAVKEGGGVVLVQDPKDAEFPSMPQSAIATGVADFIAPIAEMAERIAEVARSKDAVRSLDEHGAANQLRRIIGFLHARTGHDFSSYKRATVMRRVLRRVQVRRLLNLEEYADLLKDEPEEAQELFKDLLISVTHFFRDADAFEALAHEVIPPLLDDLGEDGLRAWVPGCATGEEAYSVAILIAEEMERRKVRYPVQIFATDLDEGALKTAREGLYPAAIEGDLSPGRLERFFIKEGSHYRIRKDVREMVLFATHSVLKDPPFLKLDLVSCRNLLIYLERSLQEKVCSLFSYALQPHRYLFLGSAETADPALELFAPVNRDARIYKASARKTRTMPVIAQHSHEVLIGAGQASGVGSKIDRADDSGSRHIAAIENVAPPSVLVGEGHQIVHLSPSAGRFILHSGGDFSGRISSVVRSELRLDLAHALDRALDHSQPTLTVALPVKFDGQLRRIAMHVLPASGDRGDTKQALVLFLDGGEVQSEGDDALSDIGESPQPDEVRRLHSELKAAKDALGQSRSEHEFSIQELRAANEELQSINEEYRSTAEELETSKEELQSMNEELHAVNVELKDKLANISHAHNDLRNLTAATEVGTLFLDSALRIRMFTPPVASLFNIKDGDVGRPVTDFTNRLNYDGIEDDVRKVLRELTPVETELESTDGRCFMMRLRPYRTTEDRIEGVVVTLVDISGRRDAEREREMLTQELSHRVKNTLAVVQGLASQTSRDVTSVEHFRDSFIARLQALGRAHSLLLASHWKSTDIADLITGGLKAYDAGKRTAITIQGPTIRLGPKQSLGLALILHEMATNASKYGPLGTPEGKLSVVWSLEESREGKEEVHLEWQESGGPSVEQPKKEGFGTRLIDRSCRFELQGSAELKFQADGLVAKISFPIT